MFLSTACLRRENFWPLGKRRVTPAPRHVNAPITAHIPVSQAIEFTFEFKTDVGAQNP
jgi:hypothetical protein